MQKMFIHSMLNYALGYLLKKTINLINKNTTCVCVPVELKFSLMRN